MERILILAPTGRDAILASSVLAEAKIEAVVCTDVEDLQQQAITGVGAILLTEEAITVEAAATLVQMLAAQDAWSDVPVVILTSGGDAQRTSLRLLHLFGPGGNVTLLERPLRPVTLTSAIQVALRARRRQYEVRDLLAQRERDLARVQSAQEEAERANRAKDQFLATLSHELRLPLTPVLMTLSALADDAEVPLMLRDQLDFMKRNVELEARLIDDLLDLTRIARGKLSLEYEPVDVHAQIKHSAAICRGSRPGMATIELRLEARKHRAWGDRARIQQIFWNLLGNAAKFTAPTGLIQVRTFNDEQDNFVAEVIDTGMGIEEAQLERIFDAFDQGSRYVTRAFGGLGLGLAICKSLVERHRGTIAAASPGRGHGAKFTVTFPSLDLPDHSVAAPVNDRPDDSPLRLLVVDDHEATAATLARLLRRAGHHLTVADNMRSALESAEGREFDLIISDLGLPDGSGLDLLRALRRRGHTCPAIALSGLGMDDDIHASRDAGFLVHLVKPVNWQHLREVIAESRYSKS